MIHRMSRIVNRTLLHSRELNLERSRNLIGLQIRRFASDEKEKKESSSSSGLWNDFKSSLDQDSKKNIDSAMNDLNRQTDEIKEKAKRLAASDTVQKSREKAEELLGKVGDETKKALNYSKNAASGLGKQFTNIWDRMHSRARQAHPETADRLIKMSMRAREFLEKSTTKTVEESQKIIKSLNDLTESGEKKLYSRRAKAEAAAAKQDAKRASQGPGIDEGTKEKAEVKISSTTAVSVVEKEKSQWEKMWDKVMGRVRETPAYKSLSKHATTTSEKIKETTAYKKSEEIGTKIRDKIDDLRDEYETTQNPIIWQLREGVEAITEESDHAIAIRELQKKDPDFNMGDFLEEMEYFMIPLVTKAYLRNDLEVLEKCCSHQAWALMNGIIDDRRKKGLTCDDRILDLDMIDLASAEISEDGEPFLVLVFRTQHVYCIRDKENNIVEGADSDIRYYHYSWVLKQDTENEEFNWRIKEFYMQGVRALI